MRKIMCSLLIIFGLVACSKEPVAESKTEQPEQEKSAVMVCRDAQTGRFVSCSKQ